ncbi:hypothetical protein Mp_1g05860 [Marchantia polymorpha subsp. ruderalis]|uniref:Uncharacterized protein n=2 Tax=Marchantia polymorpha TaxID=3197 RepID=A0AAF6ALY4_MARPO|nr:hypothetical protein MARPO_0005s0022 [Marchantia polymorpha]BBM97454.1 hypothetical protein Mp_1g05860 [Marchantia polymorpha subsp. ruderalis]|eukprot:PTQ48350.1 hypothetical protein MARPO_0005s0022 [Marchantia polymorpha]
MHAATYPREHRSCARSPETGCWRWRSGPAGPSVPGLLSIQTRPRVVTSPGRRRGNGLVWGAKGREGPRRRVVGLTGPRPQAELGSSLKAGRAAGAGAVRPNVSERLQSVSRPPGPRSPLPAAAGLGSERPPAAASLFALRSWLSLSLVLPSLARAFLAPPPPSRRSRRPLSCCIARAQHSRIAGSRATSICGYGELRILQFLPLRAVARADSAEYIAARRPPGSQLQLASGQVKDIGDLTALSEEEASSLGAPRGSKA